MKKSSAAGRSAISILLKPIGRLRRLYADPGRRQPTRIRRLGFSTTHAIELYLKAHLRALKIHPYDMRTKYGHDVGKLSKKSAELGLEFDDEDLGIFNLMSKTDAVIRSRYILTGPYSWPEISALNRACVSLRRSVGAVLVKKGEPVRM